VKDMEKFTNFLVPHNCMNNFIRTKKGYLLSIQASYAHYSEPREDGLPWDEYTKFELAIAKQGKNGLETWVYPKNDEFLKDLPVCEYFKQESPFEWAPSVAEYVPVELIQELFERCGGIS
jgi:hypothetical protein